MVECLLGRQAGGGQPGRCPARQQPTYQPAPSQPCPALGDLSQTPSGASLDSTRRKEPEGGSGSGLLLGGVEEAAPTLAYVSFLDPTLLGSSKVPSH